ncbi:MAG: tetratricopeptide repeat protein [Candidatus Eisenbacteria bacterium]|nr:tetratricopeptide repeat protein [Candidatus Eisenbacteria bacterium]
MEATLVVLVLVLLAAAILVLPLWSAREKKGLKSQLLRQQAIVDALLSDNSKQAREQLKEIIREDTDDVRSYLHLARLFRREGDRDRALAIHRTLAAREVRERALREEILAGLVEDLLALGKPEEARPFSDALREIDRRHPLVHRVELAQALEGGDWEGARSAAAALRRSGAMAKSESDSMRVWMARRQAEAGAAAEAAKQLKEIARESPEYAPASLLLGDLLAGQGEYDRAAEIWETLLKRRPESAAPLIPRLERAYFELGRFGELEQIFAGALLPEHAGTPALRIALARMALRKGQPEGALALLEEAGARDAGDQALSQWRLYLLLESGRGEEARRILKKQTEEALAAAQLRKCPYCRRPLDAAEVRCQGCRHWVPEPVTTATTEKRA